MALLSLIVLALPSAHAAGMKSSDYSVYSQNGLLYVLPKEKVLIIAFDITIPVVFTPAIPGYTIDPVTGVLTPTTLRARDVRQNPSFTLTGYILHEGDFNGDGNSDLLLQAANASTASFVLIPTLPHAESLSSLIRGDVYEVRIADKNSDGRADINIYRDGTYIRTLAASSTGDFVADNGVETPESKQVSIATRWNEFRAAMLTNNKAEMKKYIHASAMAPLSEVFDQLGTELSQIATQMGTSKPLEIREKTATFLLEKQGDNGQTYIHAITFIRESDGSWKLLQL